MIDAAPYLRRIGLDDPGPPSVEALHVLHRAHVERVPYETIEIQLERPTTVDPHEAAHRIVDNHRGGYYATPTASTPSSAASSGASRPTKPPSSTAPSGSKCCTTAFGIELDADERDVIWARVQYSR